MASANDNRGSSLVELIISIAILSIVLLPILNSFVVAARANAESKRVQAQNVIIQDIMEEMKSKKLEDIINEYNIPGDDCYEASLAALGHCFDLYFNNSYSLKSNYYLLKRDIDSKYDILISFDATPYYYTPVDRDTDYNNYQMPLVRGVNSSDHMVAYQSYETESAISILYANHVSYCSGEGIVPLSIGEVESSITRSINIDMSIVLDKIKAAVEFVYSSSVLGCGSISFELGSKTLSSSDEGIYIFYLPFSSDSINITNTTGHVLDVFAYEQSVLPNIIPVNKPADVNLYSNIPGYDGVKKNDAKNRIYNITVKLYSGNESFNPNETYIAGELLCQLQSTKGE